MAQPKSDRDEFDGGEEVFRPFVVPGRKAAELFELVKEALHQVPLTIEPLAEGWFFSYVTARRNVRPASLAVDLCPKALAVVGLVREQDAGGLDSFEQSLASRTIMRLTRREGEANRPSFGVDESMDLRRQAAARTSHAAIV